MSSAYATKFWPKETTWTKIGTIEIITKADNMWNEKALGVRLHSTMISWRIRS